jgi:hypothetical protein
VATVVAYCAGTFPDNPVDDSDDDTFTCDTPGENCPRTPGYWCQQHKQRGNGSTKFSNADVITIANCIKSKSTFLQGDAAWANARSGFGEVCTSPPMNQYKQLRRHFVALLANVCATELAPGVEPTHGGAVILNLNAPLIGGCDGVDAKTVGELIEEINKALNDGDSDKYGDLLYCADAVNNGDNVALDPSCGVETDDPDKRTGDLGANDFRLSNPAPNPFRRDTVVPYSVPTGQSNNRITIGVYNVAGRLVRTLVNGAQSPGEYQIQWDGRDNGGSRVSAGVYFVQGIHNGVRLPTTQRVIFIR